jgi:tetratricopeptide (TPR) repeat protein
MKPPWKFHFTVPRPAKGVFVELSADDAEKMLLKNLAEQKDDPGNALWDLGRFYAKNGQHDKAIDCLRKIIEREANPEIKASCVLAMGQTMEQVKDYRAAMRFYREALSMEPTHSRNWYFINNNLGFCLNTLGEFKEGELYCRRAIEIDANRPNGHKNLGIALQGQTRFHEAAQSFIAATRVNAIDPRAFDLLEKLVAEHPELALEFGEEIEFCRQAVKIAFKAMENAQPVVHRGWRKRLILAASWLKSIIRKRTPASSHASPPRE